MKRKGNLYQDTYKRENIEDAIKEVCGNTKNKRYVEKLRESIIEQTAKIYYTLKNEKYVVGPYHYFTIYEPKKREIVSQNMFDKVINHLVARHILHPTLLPCLEDFNVASRAEKGTSKGIELYMNARRYYYNRYGTYYMLKCDISKFFMSIDHDILKQKLKKRIKDKKALKIVFDIIDSNEQGLGIGNMTSQVLAIFYLNDLDHFIKEELKIKKAIRYQDDFILFHESKEYLTYCLERIKEFLAKEKLYLNKKTRIYKSTDNSIFLGINKYGKYSKYRTVNRRIKHKRYLYKKGKVDLLSLISTKINYKHLCGRENIWYPILI